MNQGGTGIAKHDRGSVLSKVALGSELTTYESSNISFFRKIRLDLIDNAQPLRVTNAKTNAAEFSLLIHMLRKSRFVDVNPCNQCTEGDTVHGVSHRVKADHRTVA